MNSPPHLLTLLATISLMALSSCTTAKKGTANADDEGLLRAMAVPNPLTEEKIEELKAIAADPASTLEERNQALEELEEPQVASVPEKSADPAIAWKRPGLDPVSISPGDVFSDNHGPILKKEFSLADSLPADQRRALFQRFTSAGTMRVPMTISRAEIAELEQIAQDPSIELPTRSVAVDFRTETFSADSSRLESLYSDLEKGNEIEELKPFPIPDSSGKQIAQIKKRLKAGEKLYVVTGVTESNQLTATYPGAPVGRRDADRIRNAVQQMYPHLDSLEATKEDKAIILSGKPRVLWEFEARELKLDADRIVIDSQALVQL